MNIPKCPNCGKIIDFQGTGKLHCWACGWYGYCSSNTEHYEDIIKTISIRNRKG